MPDLQEVAHVSAADPFEGGWAAPQWERWSCIAVELSLVVSTSILVLRPFWRGVVASGAWMPYAEDDFYYYLKIAQNLAHGAGSTFNGIVATNGYHPLWLLLLTCLSFVTTRPAAIMAFLAAIILAATFATFLLCRTLLLATGIRRLVATVLAAYIASYSSHLFELGMEVTLTIPLVLSLLVVLQRSELGDGLGKRSWIWSFGLGLLISATILSRLDAMMLVGMLVLGALAHPRVRATLARQSPAFYAGIAAGLLPVAAYFLSNRLIFHTWMPVSGMAKQLKFNHLPTAVAWHSLYSKAPASLINFLVVPAAILALPAVFKRLSPLQQVVYPTILVFPFVYIFILSCVSDWQLWRWYFYSFRPAMCLGFAVFCMWRPFKRLLETPAIGLLLAMAVAGSLFTSRWIVQHTDIYQTAVDIRRFSATHAGTYAMGDPSGMVAYLLPYPVVQTEGLVMDKKFLQSIAAQRDLRDVLREYGVRYYVASAWQPVVGCFHAVEPYQAGPGSPHMRADLCEAPVAEFGEGWPRTLIYDLDSKPGAEARGMDPNRVTAHWLDTGQGNVSD